FSFLHHSHNGTGRKASNQSQDAGVYTSCVQKAIDNSLDQTTLVAKINAKVALGSQNVSLGGSLKMKRDDVMQLSLTALGFIEAVRIEMTQDYMMIIDRMGNRYVKEAYAQIPYCQKAGIDFFVLQALFWNELFVPGQTTAASFSNYKVTERGEQSVVEVSSNSMLSVQFLLGTLSGIITQTSLMQRSRLVGPQLSWKYGSHVVVNKKMFPSQMDISIEGISAPCRLSLGLSNIKEDSSWQTRTTINESRYKKMNLSAILTLISGGL
ncbi:MAG: DUF4292 domain-containing protein, partial [Bacteroidaceae bacterium]|nr:DUF4292 domain-containing protein [Bacteroidaceae bacterium]